MFVIHCKFFFYILILHTGDTKSLDQCIYNFGEVSKIAWFFSYISCFVKRLHDFFNFCFCFRYIYIFCEYVVWPMWSQTHTQKDKYRYPRRERCGPLYYLGIKMKVQRFAPRMSQFCLIFWARIGSQTLTLSFNNWSDIHGYKTPRKIEFDGEVREG